MDGLSNEERTAILSVAKRIQAHKLMEINGYRTLVDKANNEMMKQLLIRIADEEKKHAEFWSEKTVELGEESSEPATTYFTDLKIKFMMNILGTRGFFEWAIIAEDESVEDLATRAANIRDLAASEEWTRIASDERLHIERIKKDILGMEGWEMRGGGGVRDVIFGANDGLVSILALVAGVYGAMTESYAILIAGVAGAVAGAISMGAGAYLSSKSEKEVTEKESERKGIGKRETLEEEKNKLARFYQAKGFKRQEAEAIIDRVSSEMELKQTYTVGEEIGLTSEDSWPPVKAAFLTGFSFAIASVIPILPFAFMTVTPAVITAAVASIICLFGVGASKAVFTRKSWVRSGAEMMAIGTLASAATYLITSLVGG